MADPDRRYKNVSWSTSETLTKEKLNQMAANDEWLFQNMPKAVYNAAGVKRAAGLKIMAGSSPYPAANADYARVVTNFGNYFSAGCKPVVVATVASGFSDRKYVMVQSLDGHEQIDHRGFVSWVSSYYWLVDGGKERSITRVGLVNWIAIGY